MDRLHAMTAFVAVAEAGGFAPAARRLGVSPPSTTRAVAELEARLGAKLLHRTTRAVSLTDAGARYLADCRRLLTEIEDAERQAAGVHAAPRGRVRVSASLMFGRMVVAPSLRRLLAKHPSLEADALFLDRVVNIVDEGVDVAVRIAPLPDSGLQAVRVGAVRRVVVASPDYLARHGAPATPAALQDHDVIDFVNDDRSDAWTFKLSRGAIVARPRARFRVNLADAAIAAALAGEGLTRVLSYMVADDLAAGRLQLVLDDVAPPPTPVHVVHKEAGLTSARVRATVDHLAADLRQQPLLQVSEANQPN